jgi:hypothetical protein
VVDSREESIKAYDSMSVKSESVSKEFDESDSQYDEHNEQRI